MRSAVLGLLVSLALAPSALANVRTIAPPGNSGVSQYQEDVPTANGNRPSDTIVPGGGFHGPGSSGGGISRSTVRALDRQGSAGRDAAALAEASAPTSGRSSKSGGAKASQNSQTSGASPVTSVVKALTGSSSGGGLGPLLPIILILSLLGAAALALLRRRRAT